MSQWNSGGRTLGRFSELALWTGASLAVLTAHVGAAAWLLREQPVVASSAEPPAAIMIELAPEPVAEQVEEQEISPDAVESAALEETPIEEPIKPEEPVEPEVTPPEPIEEVVPEEVVEEVVEPDPVIPEEEIDPIQELVETQLENVEVPIPVTRPPPPKTEVVKKDVPKKKEVVKKEEPKKQKIVQTQKESVKGQVQVEKSSKTAASQTARGSSASSISPAKWQSRLAAYLERRKRYPNGAKSRREEGIVSVQFTIDSSGNVLNSRIVGSSGYPELDGEILSLLKRVSPVPAPPPDANRTVTAPFRFNIR